MSVFEKLIDPMPKIPAPDPMPEAADNPHKPIVDECRNLPSCPKIFFEDEADRCRAYLDPAAIQHRCGRKDACGIMPRPDKDAIKKLTLKRKFGSRTR